MSETEEPDFISGEVIWDHKLNQDTLRDVTAVPGVPSESQITYYRLQDLLQRVYDQPYEPTVQFMGPTYAQDEIPPEKYDRNNPFHYIQRYGRQGALRSLPSVPANVLSDAQAMEILTRARRGVDAILGRGNAEALPKSDAGDNVSDVISRDEHGRFKVMGDTQETQHDYAQPVTSEPAREPSTAEESQNTAVNVDPQ